MKPPEPHLLFVPFAFVYLTDYALTLAGTARDDFHELNPAAGLMWNHGHHLAPLLAKLFGLLLVAPLIRVARGTWATRTSYLLQIATLTFSAVDTFGVLSLAR